MKVALEELKEVLDVEVLRLRPNDTLILRYPGRLSQELADHIRQSLEKSFPGHKATVLSEGASIEVLRAEESVA